MRPAGRRAGEDDRGAVIPLVALSLVVLIVMTAFSVDLGRLMTKRRDMQKLADLTALDMVRLVDGRNAGAIYGDPAWNATITASTSRNGASASNVVVTLGTSSGQGAQFLPVASNSDIPNAVQVVATDTINYFFAQVVGFISGTTSRTGVAGVTPQACYRIGSFAANVSSGNQQSLLNYLLGDALNLSALSYQGLASGTVTLGELAAALGLGSPDQVLTSSLTVAQFAAAAATVMQNHGDTANATLLNAIATQNNSSTQVSMGSLIDVSQGGSAAAAQTTFNVLDLLAGAAFVANGSSALSVPTATLAVPGLTSSSANVTVVEAPQQKCGVVNAAAAQTSQLRLHVDADIDLGLLLGVVHVGLDLQAASASANISAIACNSPQALSVPVASSLLSPSLTLTLAGVPVSVVQPPAVTSTTGTVNFQYPPDTLTVTLRSTSSSSVTLLTLFGGSLTGLPAPVSTAVGNLLTQLDPNIDPLFQFFGIKVAGADVIGDSISCSTPRLLL